MTNFAINLLVKRPRRQRQLPRGMAKPGERFDMVDASAEQWLPVVGYEGLYEVSDHGRVRSLDRIVVNTCRGGVRRTLCPGRFLSPHVRLTGHLTVHLCADGCQVTRSVHSLVCEAFHGPKPTETSVIRHLNGIPADNRAENVVWGTHSENCHDRVTHGRDLNANKTHCKRGHEFTPENTYPIKGKWRECRTCARMRCTERRRNPAVREARNAHEREQRRIAREIRQGRR